MLFGTHIAERVCIIDYRLAQIPCVKGEVCLSADLLYRKDIIKDFERNE